MRHVHTHICGGAREHTALMRHIHAEACPPLPPPRPRPRPHCRRTVKNKLTAAGYAGTLFGAAGSLSAANRSVSEARGVRFGDMKGVPTRASFIETGDVFDILPSESSPARTHAHTRTLYLASMHVRFASPRHGPPHMLG